MRPNPPRTALPYLCGGDPHVFYTAPAFNNVIYELAEVSFLQAERPRATCFSSRLKYTAQCVPQKVKPEVHEPSGANLLGKTGMQVLN